MTNQVEQPTLDDVLDAYVAEVQEPSREQLTEWIRRYPQFERELAELTVAWIQKRALAPSADHDVDEQTLVLQSMSVIQDLLHREQDLPSFDAKPNTPIKGLVIEGRAHGLSLDELAQRVKLSAPLFRILDLRLISYVTIPLELIEVMARAIQREVLSVAQYLNGKPTLPAGAKYRSEQAPRIGEQTNFFDEVRRDQEITDEDRQHWLNLELRKS